MYFVFLAIFIIAFQFVKKIKALFFHRLKVIVFIGLGCMTGVELVVNINCLRELQRKPKDNGKIILECLLLIYKAVFIE